MHYFFSVEFITSMNILCKTIVSFFFQYTWIITLLSAQKHERLNSMPIDIKVIDDQWLVVFHTAFKSWRVKSTSDAESISSVLCFTVIESLTESLRNSSPTTHFSASIYLYASFCTRRYASDIIVRCFLFL